MNTPAYHDPVEDLITYPESPRIEISSDGSGEMGITTPNVLLDVRASKPEISEEEVWVGLGETERITPDCRKFKAYAEDGIELPGHIWMKKMVLSKGEPDISNALGVPKQYFGKGEPISKSKASDLLTRERLFIKHKVPVSEAGEYIMGLGEFLRATKELSSKEMSDERIDEIAKKVASEKGGAFYGDYYGAARSALQEYNKGLG